MSGNRIRTLLADAAPARVVAFIAGMLPNLAALLVGVIIKYRKDVARGLYRYRNVLDMGLIVYLVFLFLLQVPYMLRNDGLSQTVSSLLGSASAFTIVAFPLAFLVSVLVAFSNIRLMLRKG